MQTPKRVLATLFVIAPNWKVQKDLLSQLKRLSRVEQINKPRYISTVEYYSAMKINYSHMQ